MGVCRIRHRELVASITGSAAFGIAAGFPLNPGLAVSFPWLSVEAQAWECYHFNSLKYEYFTRTGTSTPGSLLLAPDYDAADGSPQNEQVASSYMSTEEDAPWKDIVCVLDEKSLAAGVSKKFVRTQSILPANLDVKTYDSGNMWVCTTDGSAVSWGKLWVEYDVTFYTPQLPSAGAVFMAGGAIQGGGTITPAAPLGTAPIITVQAQGIAILGNNAIEFLNTGQYLFTLQMNGTGITFMSCTAAAGATVVALTALNVNAAATLIEQTYIVTINVPTAYVTLAATATTLTACSSFAAVAPPASL